MNAPIRTAATAADFTGLRDLYERCFPVAERTPWPELQDSLLARRELALVAGNAPALDALDALAVLTPLPSVSATLLSYLAVSPDVRGSGLGGAMLHAAAAVAAGSGHDWLLLEVEHPDGPAHDWFGDPHARLRFYRAHGCLEVADWYAMPDLAATDPTAVVDLLLLAMPTATCDPATTDRSAPGSTPSEALVGAWVRALWGPENYGRDADDVALAQVLDRRRAHQNA